MFWHMHIAVFPVAVKFVQAFCKIKENSLYLEIKEILVDFEKEHILRILSVRTGRPLSYSPQELSEPSTLAVKFQHCPTFWKT